MAELNRSAPLINPPILPHMHDIFDLDETVRRNYLPKKFENFCALSVAEVTISLKSRHLATTFLRIPNSTSVLNDFTWVSSITMTLQYFIII